LTFVATEIDEMFQNYEFKLVDGKCCPECVEGAHQFQVLPPLYFSLSIFFNFRINHIQWMQKLPFILHFL